MKSIEKSPQVRAQEAQLTELEAQIKKVRTTIKSLKTRMQNNRTRFEQMQQHMMTQAMRLQEQLQQVTKKIQDLLDKMTKDKRFSKADKKMLKELRTEMLGEMEMFEEQPIPDFEQADEGQERAEKHDPFAQFQQEVERPERQDLRKLYLRLSKQFHPDRARNEQEQATFHNLQQQIIQAYEQNDYQTLSDFEQIYGNIDAVASDTEGDTDVLSAKIKQRQIQLTQLQAQKDRLSAEIKAFRKSNFGQMLTTVDGARREGYDLEDVTGISQVEYSIRELQQILTDLEKSHQSGTISTGLRQLLEPQEVDMFDLFNSIFDGMDDDDTDEDFWYTEAGEEEDEEFFIHPPNPNPKFPVGTPVRVSDSFELTWEDHLGEEVYDHIKGGIRGRITHCLLNDENQPIYHLKVADGEFKKLPESYQRYVVLSFGLEPDTCINIPEKLLQKDRKHQPAINKRQLRAVREAWMNYLFDDDEPAELAAIKQVVLTDPTASLHENWYSYLNQHLSFPLPVKTLEVMMFPKNATLYIQKLASFDEYDGLMVEVTYKRDKFLAPLLDFESKDPSVNILLGAYRSYAWEFL